MTVIKMQFFKEYVNDQKLFTSHVLYMQNTCQKS